MCYGCNSKFVEGFIFYKHLLLCMKKNAKIFKNTFHFIFWAFFDSKIQQN